MSARTYNIASCYKCHMIIVLWARETNENVFSSTYYIIILITVTRNGLHVKNSSNIMHTFVKNLLL